MEEKKQDGESGFRIVDKRRFNEEGEAKVSSESSEPQSSKEEPEQGASEENLESFTGSSPKVDFPSFIVSLATQALMMMGDIPDPESKLVSMNLSAARQTIDIIAMLEEKTKGNLSDDEKQLLDQVLDSLRMAFVKKLNEQ